VKGTVICVTAEHLPGGRKPLRDLRLWHHGPAEADAGLADLLWKAYLRRFDQEHNAAVPIMRRREPESVVLAVSGLGLSA
jgi:hypothetical protein